MLKKIQNLALVYSVFHHCLSSNFTFLPHQAHSCLCTFVHTYYVVRKYFKCPDFLTVQYEVRNTYFTIITNTLRDVKHLGSYLVHGKNSTLNENVKCKGMYKSYSNSSGYPHYWKKIPFQHSLYCKSKSHIKMNCVYQCCIELYKEQIILVTNISSLQLRLKNRSLF